MECPVSRPSGQETMWCTDCEYKCGCEEYLKNTSFCCKRSYSCDSDEDDTDGFTMGSILRQVWFIFIVFGVISTIIYRRPVCHRVPFPPPLATALPPFPLSLLPSTRRFLPL
jgi:hypothetical protein